MATAKHVSKVRVEDCEFIPDWSHRWNAAQAELELDGFKFQGPGIYRHGKDVLLVVPTERDRATLWNKAFKAGEVFRFLVYTDRDPCDAFHLIVNAPGRGAGFVTAAPPPAATVVVQC